MAGRKKSAAINDLIAAGAVSDGELLRYKNKQGQVLLIGRARYGGIEVQGQPGLLNFTAFEAAAGSKYHRPAEHTHSLAGRTLQSLQLSVAAGGAAGSEPVGGEPARRSSAGEELLEDEHDEFCYVCGLGGDIMCCETCSATMHAPCAGLAEVPEGDWHCPWCHCGGCGNPGWTPGGRSLRTGVTWVECGEQRYRGWDTLGADMARPPFVGGPEASASDDGGGGLPSAVAVAPGGAEEGKAEVAGLAAAAAAPRAPPREPAGGAGSSVGVVKMELDEGAGAPAGPAVLGQPAGFSAPGEGSTIAMTGAPANNGGTGAAAGAGASNGVSGETSRAGRLDLSQLLALLAEAAASLPVSSTSHAQSVVEAGLPSAAAAEAGPAAADVSVVEARCPSTGQRFHGHCLPHHVQQAAQQAAQQGSSSLPAWFSSQAAELASWQLAQLCSRGLVPVGALGDGTPLTFQLVRGAAVAQPEDCSGYAPWYNDIQRQQLRQALSAAAHILQSCYQPVHDSRTGGNATLWMLRGASLAGGELDFSAMHTALLYAGSSLVAAACLRLHGPSTAEVPLLAVRPEVQRNKLGSALLAVLEALLAAVSRSAATPPAPPAAAPAATLVRGATGQEEEKTSVDDAAGAGDAGEGQGEALLLTPAFWGPGSPYLAYPPGQPGVPDVVPITQARWGYALATREQLLRAWAHPLVRLPGLLLACKQLGAAQPLEPRLQLPHRLVLNEAGCDLAALLKEGTVVAALPPAASQHQSGGEGTAVKVECTVGMLSRFPSEG
ncbi:hypothetical protein N2152v2_001426 [Parachlorella kessleri]